MDSLFASAYLGNLTFTVYIRHAAVYLKTCEAYGAAPRNPAVALIKLYHGERFKFKYTGFLERSTLILCCM